MCATVCNQNTQTQSAHLPETLTALLVTGQTPLCSPDLPPAFGLRAHTTFTPHPPHEDRPSLKDPVWFRQRCCSQNG